MRIVPSLTAVAFALVSCLAALPARAQTTPPPAKPEPAKPDAKPDAAATAKPPPGPSPADLVKKGVEQCDHGELEDGIATLTAAWSRKQDVDTAVALAACEIKSTQWAGASEHLAFALRIVGEGEPRAALEKSFVDARGHVAAVKVTVTVDGADVFVANRYVGQSPLAGEIYVMPGSTRISAKRPGFGEVEKTIDVKAKGEASVSLDLNGGPTRQTVTTAARNGTPGLVLAGLGVAAAAVGGALYAAAISKGSAADQLFDEVKVGYPALGDNPCPPPKSTNIGCATVLSLRQSHDALFNAGTGTMVAGGALIATGIIYGIWSSATPTTSSTLGSTERVSLTIAPTASDKGGALIVLGRF